MPMKLPMAVLDECVGHNIWIVMKGKREFSGILRGFDDYFNAVLQNVCEVWYDQEDRQLRQHQSVLLNGHDIAYMVPGTDPLKKELTTVK